MSISSSELIFLEAAHNDIERVFRNILPLHGHTPREGQISLCHTMLEVLAKGNIALADAGVGVGKTDAYIVAAALLHKYHARCFKNHGLHEIGEGAMPFVISTSSIQLQQAIADRYIPFLSKAMLEAGLLTEPFQGEIRKGKRNYACRDRALHRINTANMERKNQRHKEALLRLREEYDLDRIPNLSGYDRMRVCVPDGCPEVCEHSDRCRYMRYVIGSRQRPALFQICNHHFLLADAKHKEDVGPPLLPCYRGLIIDEAHLLYEAAQSICGQSISVEDVRRIVNALKQERRNAFANQLWASFEGLFQAILRQAAKSELFNRDAACRVLLKQTLTVIKDGEKNMGASCRNLARNLGVMRSVLERFLGEYRDVYCLIELDDRGHPSLRTVEKQYRTALCHLLWEKKIGFVLTSGTLAAGKDMAFIKSRLGLAGDPRVMESITPSPFDYGNNSLLYLPKEMPPCNDRENFRQAAADEITRLIRATHGHTLVLFTSYAEMKEVFDRLKEKELSYPLFAMFGRGDNYLSVFRHSGNGVLLNTRMEGVDYPGDQVSSLIIPRLPFPRRDAIHQGDKARYQETRQFVREVALPEMLLKLRQAAGRGMRLVTDTCVISILDSRCAPEGNYHHDVLDALPPYPVTRELADVEAFIRAKKSSAYFEMESKYE